MTPLKTKVVAIGLLFFVLATPQTMAGVCRAVPNNDYNQSMIDLYDKIETPESPFMDACLELIQGVDSVLISLGISGSMAVAAAVAASVFGNQICAALINETDLNEEKQRQLDDLQSLNNNLRNVQQYYNSKYNSKYNKDVRDAMIIIDAFSQTAQNGGTSSQTGQTGTSADTQSTPSTTLDSSTYSAPTYGYEPAPAPAQVSGNTSGNTGNTSSSRRFSLVR